MKAIIFLIIAAVFLGMKGLDKVRWVMEHEPKLLRRISSKAVASYLGMTNSTLSKLT